MQRYGEAEDKYEALVPKFRGNPAEDFNHSAIRVTTALRSRELATALTSDDIHIRADERTIARIVAAFGDSPLRTIQEGNTTKATSTKLQ